jgi:hypothetical protein
LISPLALVKNALGFWYARRLEMTRSYLSVVAMLLASNAAFAEEQTVKNDSIVNFGQAVIVGDFVTNEMAGARLTSPCDGTIVAVQVLWLEGTPGHLPIIESAIYIWNGNTFPTPGTELAFLDSPLLTPGYWNEFRYLDEEQTTPLAVPVTQGQQFYVALQFAEPTDVGNGGPSVVRDLDGCQAGKNVLYAIPGGWMNFCIYLAGDLAIRAIVDCPGPGGACCHADGTCTNNAQQSDCQSFGDVWSSGQTCAQVTCAPRGACCRAGGCLQLIPESQCTSIGGVWAGAGSDCNQSACVAGACCLPATGECVQKFEFQCSDLGGTFLGHGVSCGPPNPCPQPTGACCFGTICITGQTHADCTAAGGTWAGAGTNCADSNSNGIPDACDTNTVCIGDLNCDGAIDFGDINPFVLYMSNSASWAAAFPGCNPLNGDINCDGTYGQASFGDINPFVALMSQCGMGCVCPGPFACP